MVNNKALREYHAFKHRCYHHALESFQLCALNTLEFYGLDVLYSHHTSYTFEHNCPLVFRPSQSWTVDFFKFYLHRFDILRLLVKLYTVNQNIDHVFKFF